MFQFNGFNLASMAEPVTTQDWEKQFRMAILYPEEPSKNEFLPISFSCPANGEGTIELDSLSLSGAVQRISAKYHNNQIANVRLLGGTENNYITFLNGAISDLSNYDDKKGANYIVTVLSAMNKIICQKSEASVLFAKHTKLNRIYIKKL